MIQPQELIFVVDEHNNPLDPLPRQFAHENGMWHRTTGIWIINSHKQILCQKRSIKKDVKAGLWEAFFGGHVPVGQSYVQSAVQETKEELGLKIPQQDLILYKVFKNKDEHSEFQHVFGLILDRDIENFAFEKDEIDELKWLDTDALKNILIDPGGVDWVHKPWDQEVLSWLPTLFLA